MTSGSGQNERKAISRGGDAHRALTWLSRALQVEDPFPWQRALLARMLEGQTPRAIDIPTGLGKTAVMAIWLVARAMGAAVPRRLAYVVDRRAVIDQATDVALGLRKVVADFPGLAAGLGLTDALPISTLRGQLVDNREWLADPATPAIILGTVDMIGSRLLFEGYGVSRRMRPYHAGLLGVDTLVVLDEAHLVRPFEAMIEAIAERGPLGPREELAGLVPPLRLLSLSATGRSVSDTLTLGDEDRAHAQVVRRLGARKVLVVRDAVDPGELPERLAREAWQRAERGAHPVRCIIFCDRRLDALAVREALMKCAGDKEIDVELFVGGRRVWDRARAAEWLAARGFFAGRQATPTKPTFVVATSAGEVGVDLDADYMACDVVPWERMVQRLGRVNRRGERESVVVVIPVLPDKKVAVALEKEGGEEGPSLEVARHRRQEKCCTLLGRLPHLGEGVDASPGALVALKQRGDLTDLIAEASSPAQLRPRLERPLVDAWSMTSLAEHAGRPEIQPWLRGWVEEDAPETTVVWRRDLPVHRGGALPPPEVERFFEAAAPYLLEELTLETHHVLGWIERRIMAVLQRPRRSKDEGVDADARGDDAAASPDMRVGEAYGFILFADGGAQPLELRPMGKRDRDRLARDLAGATLIVDVRLGGLREGLLADDVDDPTCEVGDLLADEPEKLRPFQTRVVVPAPDEDRATTPDPEWREELRLGVGPNAEGEPSRWLVVEAHRRATPNLEDARSTSREQSLVEHQAWVERHARLLGERLQLPSELIEVLALAARLHDEGKRAPRWQRAFHVSPQSEPLAKTARPPNLRLLDGYRHEFGSLLRAEGHARVAALEPEWRELCLHLIAAHHGNARPLISTESCDDAPPSALLTRARAVALRFAHLQARWGPWGLAWLEALLRAADQRASRDNDARSD